MSENISPDQIGVDILAEFVEVAIHNILYNRKLYPQGVFEKRNKYNVPVQMCLHPEVCNYINKIIDSVKLMLTEGQVDRISVVILDHNTQELQERFVMEISSFHHHWVEKDPQLLQTEQALRGFLLKLSVSDAMLKPASKDNTWSVHIHTSESSLASVDKQLLEKNFPWVEAEEKQQTMNNSKLVPIRSYNGDMLNMQMYAEEACPRS